MKIYNTDLTTQNFGSALLVILRGTTENVNETFNSFFNLGGANGEIDISENSANTVGTFWTSKPLLCRYWQNRFLALNTDANDKKVYANQDEDANLFVEMNIKEMLQNSEAFMNFDKNYFEEGYSVGKISAEAPDLDFRDAVVTHAFTPKHSVNEKNPNESD